MKNTLILLALTCVIFLLQSAWAQSSPCKPGYVEPEDCAEQAIDPAGGNCYWGAVLHIFLIPCNNYIRIMEIAFGLMVITKRTVQVSVTIAWSAFIILDAVPLEVQ